ncbi:MAG: hypothetical protein V4450_08870 [Bacteroidota bacterium]
MNDTFSFLRFGLLIKKFTKEHAVTYLLYAAAAFGILFLIYGLTVLGVLHGRFPQDAAVIYFMGGSIFGSCLFSAAFYGFFQNHAKGVQYLNLPASHTEKLLLGFLFTQVIFFISFVAVFFLVDQVMCGLYNQFHIMPTNVTPEYIPLYHAKPMNFGDPMVTGSFTVALILSAICHLGSLGFEKHAFVKTALLILVIGAVLMYANFFFMRSMIPEESMPGGMFYSKSLRIGANDAIKGIVFLPKSWTSFLYWFIPGMLYLLFWLSAYFKLKEKQI